MKYHYDNLLERLNLLTLHNRRRQFDALFLINVFSGTKCCPSVLEIVSFELLLGTLVILLATALQLDVFEWQTQYVNLQIFLGTLV
jgi:hypothetical protein